jgi:hypothetical protein
MIRRRALRRKRFWISCPSQQGLAASARERSVLHSRYCEGFPDEHNARGQHRARAASCTGHLVLLNIAAIVGLRWLSTAAQIGPSSLVLWLLGMLCFVMPMALAVFELSSRLPGEGGLHLWAKAAFGDLHGFVAGWTCWMSNLVFSARWRSVFAAGILWLSRLWQRGPRQLTPVAQSGFAAELAAGSARPSSRATLKRGSTNWK